MNVFIHPLADVRATKIGKGTKIWQFCILFENVVIGDNCNICAYVLVENKVIIGNKVTVKPGVGLCEGVILEDDVFIGAGVCFTNDIYPRSKQYQDSYLKTVVKKGATIGTNASVIAGSIVGEYAMVGAGSVVTKDIPPYTLWYGNPACHRAYITKGREIISLDLEDKNGNKYKLLSSGEPVKIEKK